MDIKDIHIGRIIKQLWDDKGIPLDRVRNFIKCDEDEIYLMLEQKSLDTECLLRWSKLLEYDFFRIYSQHLILFAPVASNQYRAKKEPTNSLSGSIPSFRKNVYTKEIIDYLLELVESNEKTPVDIINEYKIPKTTFYKWIQKYKKSTT